MGLDKDCLNYTRTLHLCIGIIISYIEISQLSALETSYIPIFFSNLGSITGIVR